MPPPHSGGASAGEITELSAEPVSAASEGAHLTGEAASCGADGELLLPASEGARVTAEVAACPGAEAAKQPRKAGKGNRYSNMYSVYGNLASSSPHDAAAAPRHQQKTVLDQIMQVLSPRPAIFCNVNYFIVSFCGLLTCTMSDWGPGSSRGYDCGALALRHLLVLLLDCE